MVPLVLFSFFIANKNIAHSDVMEELHKIVDPMQLKCLATNIFYEARMESVIGQAAVAWVVLNRVTHGFASTPCKVVYQTNLITTDNGLVKLCQFSWVCEGKGKPNERDPRFVNAMNVAYQVLAYNKYKEVLPRNTLFFHSNQIEPNWPHRKVKEIGNHVFYARK